mmetsp:Transcript_47784/g.104037  ORF Transcript_47784/g.104037 Transcript_47784/m.104037 type:complete len:428 (-) Transcript_47784:70-1353(-)
MEVLCQLFDTVSTASEFFGRALDKAQELSLLSATVQSVGQSFRTFVNELPQDERISVYESNQVFPHMLKQLKECEEVIERHQERCLEAASPSKPALQDKKPEEKSDEKPNGTFSSLRRLSWSKESKKTFQELKEVIGGRLGNIGTQLLKLPEDELQVIRKASEELARLVPLLQLAIAAHAQRGLKRSFSQMATSATSVAVRSGVSITSCTSDPGDTLLLQLVSNSPLARGCELPRLTPRDLRTTTGRSTSSLESNGGESPATPRLVFGRQELRNLPSVLTLPSGPNQPRRPFSLYVSRELLSLEVLPESSTVTSTTAESMETLTFGGGYTEEAAATLAWGVESAVEVAPPSPLAVVTALSAGGLHKRSRGETRWCWYSKDSKADVFDGDCVALILESPPGSATPASRCDLSADEANCLLGLELHRPG